MDPIATARRYFHFELAVESAGVFWIAAELAILIAMSVAVRVLRQRPIPDSLALTPRERRDALLALATILLLALFVYGRHALLPPLPFALEQIADSDSLRARVRDIYLARAHLHIGLWCSLIASWVALEIAIVAQGIRAFYRLRALVQETRV